MSLHLKHKIAVAIPAESTPLHVQVYKHHMHHMHYLFIYLLRHIYTGWTLLAVRLFFHMCPVVILLYENKHSII